MKKSTIIAILVFSCLVVLMIIKMDQKTERGITRVSFSDVDTSIINRISIKGPNPIELRMIDDVWLIGDAHEADQQAVEKLVQAIPKIKSSRLVTKDSNRYQELEVNEEKGVHLTAYAAHINVADFFVGKTDPGGVNLRVDESVYLVSNIASNVFTKKTIQWYNLKLFNTPYDQVERFELIHDYHTVFGLIRHENTWRFVDPNVVPKGFRFDAMAARSIVSTLGNLRANRIVLDHVKPDETGLEGKHNILVLVTKDDKRKELHFGAATQNNEVYAKILGKDEIYLLSQSTVQSLDIKPVDLRDMKLVELDIEKVVKLSLRNGPKKLSLEKEGNVWKVSKTNEKVPTDFQLDQPSITRRLTSMANAKGIGLLSGATAPQSGIRQAKTSITATMDNATEVSIQFGSKAKLKDLEGYYARGNIDKEYYLVSKYTRDMLLSLLSSFRKMPTPKGIPNIDPKTLAKLPPDIREKILQQLRQKAMQQKIIEAAHNPSSDQTTKSQNIKRPATP